MLSPIDLPAIGRVGVLSGGRSRERTRSLLSGRAVCASLLRQGFTVDQIDTSDRNLTARLRNGVDVAFLAIAGQYAEDGKLQGLLEHLDIPYTGSGVLASALGMSKPAAKSVVSAHGVNVLPGCLIDPDQSTELAAKDLLRDIGVPLMLKPTSEGGSIDMCLVRSGGQLTACIDELRASGQAVFAERFCQGRSLTVGVLETEDGLRTLPVLEVRTAGDFYDHATKNDPSQFVYQCPAEMPDHVQGLAAEWAKQAHRALGCFGYSRSDFIMDVCTDEVWWLEINTLPGLSATGNMATMAAAAGIDYDTLIRHILSTAFAKQGYQP